MKSNDGKAFCAFISKTIKRKQFICEKDLNFLELMGIMPLVYFKPIELNWFFLGWFNDVTKKIKESFFFYFFETYSSFFFWIIRLIKIYRSFIWINNNPWGSSFLWIHFLFGLFKIRIFFFISSIMEMIFTDFLNVCLNCAKVRSFNI